MSSSNLASVGYDEDRRILEIAFRAGGVYQYRGVPGTVYAALMAASSKGGYHAAAIKGRYAYSRVG